MLSDKCVYSVIKWLNNSNKKIGKKFEFFLKKKIEKRKKKGPTFSTGSCYEPVPKVSSPAGSSGATWRNL